jgi:hypothetical protein
LAAGAIVASVLDAATLGWTPAERPKAERFAIAPSIAPIKGGSVWGLSGRF